MDLDGKLSGNDTQFTLIYRSFGQLILFPYSHTELPGPEFMKHLYAARSLADGIKTVNNRKYSSGAVGLLLCKLKRNKVTLYPYEY